VIVERTMFQTLTTARIVRGAGLLAWCGLAVLLALWLSRSIMMWDEVGLIPLLICVALALMVWIVLQPIVGLYVLMAVPCLLIRLVEMKRLPGPTPWLVDLVIACWGIHVAIRCVARRELPRTPFDVLLILLAVVFTLSSLANTLGPGQVIVGFRYYLKYPLAFCLMMAIRFPRATLRRAILVMVGIALLQIPLTIKQFIEIGVPHDSVTGTLNLNGSGLMAFFQLTVASLLVGAYFTGIVSSRVAALAGLTIIPPLLGTVQAMFFFFPFVMACLAVPLLITRNTRMLRRYVTVAVVVPLMIGVVAMVASPQARDKVIHHNTMYITSMDKAVKYNSEPGGGRMRSLTDAWNVSSTGYAGRWLGLGPGMAGESAYNDAALRKQAKPTAIVTQIDFLLVDLGLLGVLAALSVVGWAYVVNLRAFRHARSDADRTVTFALFGVIPLFGLFFLYLGCWINDLSALLFWLSLVYISPIAERGAAPVARGMPLGMPAEALSRQG
jgi:hypothetical protein